MGLVPVAVLLAITALLAVRSVESLVNVGPARLFSNDFSSQYGTGKYVYGLLPGIWGTLSVTFLAVAIAFPISMAMALISSEFSLGIVGKVMRVLLGALGGIPSIVYALAGIAFLRTFTIPKLAADSTFATFTPDKIGYTGEWPPSDVPFNAGAFPWDPSGLNNSTLLGGILIALFVIPFLAPMLDDAIRGVPSAPREASLALGLDRWQTFRRVILPYAMPGIISATALATLKAMGDTMIVIFTIGFESAKIPNPPIDVFERDAPLTAVGADLLGGFQGLGGCRPEGCDTGFFSAFLLLIAAFAIVLVSSILQNRFRRRYAR